MKEIESIASALFDKVRSRFSNVTLGDEKAKAAQDPEKARFFNFTYTGKDGVEFGTVTLSLIDETSLKVYYGQNISGDMGREQRKEWYEFLRNLRQFAKRNLLTFDTRDINKSNLELKDIKQQAKVDDVATTADIAVTESKLYGTPDRPYNSFGEEGTCKLLIKHSDKVNDDVRGSRARKIESIFIETELGERFLLEFTNLHGARAMACHLSEGGSIHDERAEHIVSLVKEMSAMRHFVRSTKHRQFEDQETADMTRSAVQHYDQVKRTLRNMRHARGYKHYFETFSPAENPLEDIDVDALKERFVKKIYDERFNEALPIVFREYVKQKASIGDMGAELEEWADNITAPVTESTWAKPDSADKIRALVELLKNPILVGVDGIDAITKIEPIIGDDELNHAIQDLAANHGPDADATVEIKKWLVQVMPSVLKKLEVGKSNSRDAETNWDLPSSPQHTNDNEYASTPAHSNISNIAY